MIHKVPVPLLQKDYEWPGWDNFRDLITRDMANLNKAAVSARTQAERVNLRHGLVMASYTIAIEL